MRGIDIVVSAIGLALLSPLLLVVLLLVAMQDGHSPLYIAERVGLNAKPFRMVKIRSMVVHADRSGVESTSVADDRITTVGRFVRRWKLDELTQLWNVLKGDMSLVGPRPNTRREVSTYSSREMELLSVRPGVTDFSSIVFSDEGEILQGSANPDLDYRRFIRPWKGELGLLYLRSASVSLNLKLIGLTALGIVNKQRALLGIAHLLERCGAEDILIRVCARREPLSNFEPCFASENWDR